MANPSHNPAGALPPMGGAGGSGDELAVIRRRQAEARAAIDRALAGRAPGGVAKMLGTVYNGGSMPTTVPGVFLVHPTDVDCTETEGAAVSLGADLSDGVAVCVLGPGVPGVGDRLTAFAIQGRWVAQMGGYRTGHYKVTISGCNGGPLGMALHVVLTQAGATIADYTTDLVGGGPTFDFAPAAGPLAIDITGTRIQPYHAADIRGGFGPPVAGVQTWHTGIDIFNILVASGYVCSGTGCGPPMKTTLTATDSFFGSTFTLSYPDPISGANLWGGCASYAVGGVATPVYYTFYGGSPGPSNMNVAIEYPRNVSPGPPFADATCANANAWAFLGGGNPWAPLTDRGGILKVCDLPYAFTIPVPTSPLGIYGGATTNISISE